MSTPAQNKRRYRLDPDFRAAVLASNRRSREKHASPERDRLNCIASEIHRLRNSIDIHLRTTAAYERRLFALVAERERLKQICRAARLGKTGTPQNVL